MMTLRRPSTRVLVLGWMLWTGAASPAQAADDFERYVTAIRRHYDNLDNEEALEQLQRARRIARGVDQDVTLGLYEGLILADLNRWQEARSAFFTVLLLRPDARLPLRGSPKVEKEFEEQRLRAREELARMQPAPEQVTPAESTTQPAAEPTPPEVSDRPELTHLQPAPLPSDDLTTRKAPSRVPVLPSMLLAAGITAGGLGLYFGTVANSQLTTARSNPQRSVALRAFRDAQGSALGANIALGTAALAISGSIVTWLFSRDPAAPPAAPTPEEVAR